MNHRTEGLPPRAGVLVRAAVIVLAAVWIYWPALRGQWLWDDVPEIVENSAAHDPAGLGAIWLRPAGPDFLPLKTTVQWLEWRLWQDRPAGYHLTNVGLQALNALLLWGLLRRLGLRTGWLGGMLFVVHPLTVESVAWISELKNTLSLAWLLLAMGCYLDFDRRVFSPGAGRGGSRSYLLSLGFFLAAMLCKSSVVMFPAVILLYAWWRRGRIARADLRASTPFFAISLVLGLVTVWFQERGAIAGVDLALGGWLSRAAAAGLAVAFYFGKCVFPLGLAMIYPRWEVAAPSALQLLPWVGIAALAGWLWTKRAGWGRAALFGLGFFLLTLLPVLGFVPMAYLRLSRVADHFAYLPLVGVVGLAAWFVGRWAKAESSSWLRSAWFRNLLVAGVLLALAGASRHRAAVFRTEETLWSDTVARNPEAWVAHHGLGLAFLRSGRLEEARSEFEATLRLNPALAAAHYNLAGTLAREGRREAAISEDREAARLKPDYAEAWYNLAGLLLEQGQVADSASAYAVAVRLRPDQADAHVNYGNVLAQLDRETEAMREYQAALRLEPGAADVRNNLGGLLAGAGHWQEAKFQFEEALRLKPDYREARENLARVEALERSGTGP